MFAILSLLFVVIHTATREVQYSHTSLDSHEALGANVTSSESNDLDPCEDAELRTNQLFDDYWEWKLLQYPEGATVLGIHKYDNKLDDISEANFEKKMKRVVHFLEKATDLRPCLKHSNLISLKFMISQLELFRDGIKFQGYFFPNNNLFSIKSELQRIFGKMPLKTLYDYDVMLSRMREIPKKIDQLIALFRKGMQKERTYNWNSIKGLSESLKKFGVASAEKSYFYTFFSGSYPDSVTPQDVETLKGKAERIINKMLRPAFQMYVDFLNNEYKTRDEIAVTSIKPDGGEIYEQLIWFHTSSNMTSQEIHKIGLSEVESIETSMKEIIKEVGYGDISLRKFSEVIKTNASNYYESAEDLLNGYRDIVKESTEQLSKFFNTIPKAQLKVKGNPSPYFPLASYISPTLDGSVPGTFFVATYDPKSAPKFLMPTITLHEGSPGHHHQISLIMESNAPKFRKAFLGEGLNMVPTGFSYPGAYIEGWALYAESLGFEMNMFKNPLDRYGYFSSEMHRACRLVVDTGIHALNWTREKAIDYMMTYLMLSEKAIEGEVDRYITWPGQALSYKIGQLKMIELRDRAMNQLKEHFDIKEFHDVVMTAPGPLSILEAEVNSWIEVKCEEVC